jgi:hypothetical protein
MKFNNNFKERLSASRKLQLRTSMLSAYCSSHIVTSVKSSSFSLSLIFKCIFCPQIMFVTLDALNYVFLTPLSTRPISLSRSLEVI